MQLLQKLGMLLFSSYLYYNWKAHLIQLVYALAFKKNIKIFEPVSSYEFINFPMDIKFILQGSNIILF